MPNLQHAPTARPATSRSKPGFSSQTLDDAASENVFRLADAMANDLDVLRRALDTVCRSAYEEPRYNRKRARKMVLEVLHDLNRVARVLSEPAPRFRPNHGNVMPIVRRRQVDPEIADLVPTSLPTAAMVEA